MPGAPLPAGFPPGRTSAQLQHPSNQAAGRGRHNSTTDLTKAHLHPRDIGGGGVVIIMLGFIKATWLCHVQGADKLPAD